MTKVDLLDALAEFTQAATKDLIMPVRIQKEGEEQTYRAAQVFKTRLPDSKAAQKKAPYILHQVVTSKDQQPSGDEVESFTTVRSIFCVYCDDEQEGGLMLLNLMERVRISLLKEIVIGKQFELDLDPGGAGIECLVYPDDTAPYFLGEMATTWKMPKIKREVPQIWQ